MASQISNSMEDNSREEKNEAGGGAPMGLLAGLFAAKAANKGTDDVGGSTFELKKP